jgi:glycosyltransferase involved in cell wall biosynthesis
MAVEVSVIVPTYNRAELIVPTLQSILGQSYKPAQVIVVDDGSSDHTEAVVRGFGPAVTYLRVENGGQARARNIGIASAQGSWVAFCDSDDLWHPEKLSLQVRLLERAPDVKYTFTNFKTVVNDRWSEKTKFDSSPPGYWNPQRRDIEKDLFVIDEPMVERLLRHQPIFPSTIMMERSFLEAVGPFQESLRMSEDLEFTLRCVTRAPIGVVSAPVVGIRKHNANFSGDALRSLVGEIEIFRYVLKDHPWAKQYAHAIHEQIIVRSAAAAELAFETGELEKTRELLEAVPYSRRSWKLQVKGLISQSPRALGQVLRKTTLALSAQGSVR